MKQVNENNGISRRESIYELLKEQTTVYVKDLSQKFCVSDMTIRRDLHIMEEQGILVTHYGGATIRHPSSVIHTFDMRKESFFEAKAAIARRAVEFIKENDVIYLDPSTTVLLMTRYLPPLHHTACTCLPRLVIRLPRRLRNCSPDGNGRRPHPGPGTPLRLHRCLLRRPHLLHPCRPIRSIRS